MRALEYTHKESSKGSSSSNALLQAVVTQQEHLMLHWIPHLSGDVHVQQVHWLSALGGGQPPSWLPPAAARSWRR